MNQSNYNYLFGDKRIERRGEQLLSSLFRAGYSSIQSISNSRAEQKGYYRFLKNDKVQEDLLIREMVERCGKVSAGNVVLSIQDTTEINLCDHSGRILYDESLGPINDTIRGIGFKLHPSLVIDARTSYPYGYSGIEVWSREHQRQEVSHYVQQRMSVSEKESQVWVDSNEQTYKSLSAAQAVIIIQDREGDFYEQFAMAPQDGKFFLLVRSNHNRRLEQGVKLWDHIEGLPVAGHYRTTISYQHKDKTRKKREADIAVKIGKVKLKKPHKKAASMPGSSVQLTVIEAREVNTDFADPILWRLYTTWPVEDFEQAHTVIEWYRCRWFIEEVFKVLKRNVLILKAVSWKVVGASANLPSCCWTRSLSCFRCQLPTVWRKGIVLIREQCLRMRK
ncbi:IS4 family transposase [Paraflavitalea speifideaquila]|uniref:IS4 family transposase n=2 Tax=Paraflavitalea speifideaquila TaxID=3076558 RepID=UPI0028E76D90|nr:IS4 family transposase [Paraflavitalea speifideiaquila]